MPLDDQAQRTRTAEKAMIAQEPPRRCGVRRSARLGVQAVLAVEVQELGRGDVSWARHQREAPGIKSVPHYLRAISRMITGAQSGRPRWNSSRGSQPRSGSKHSNR
jgi:hypothetical protein